VATVTDVFLNGSVGVEAGTAANMNHSSDIKHERDK
jgi:hypothetical protein